jgi:hypothetical protein
LSRVHGFGWIDSKQLDSDGAAHFKPLAAEAWRRFEAGELTDNELYCYQAAKARIGKERNEVMRTTPWLMTDHFAA